MNSIERSIASPLRLRSGLSIANRLVKAATSERLAEPDGTPSPGLIQVYKRFGEGGAGLLITGNAIVGFGGMEVRGNVVLDGPSKRHALRAWASIAQANGSKLIAQLNHAGRQSPKSVTRNPVAPSAVPLRGAWGLAAKPRALLSHEIEALVVKFAHAAHEAYAAGFSGVQIHAAHGYLLSQFLSPLTNQRTDEWGGTIDRRMRMLLEVVRAARAATSPDFSISVKLNSADFQRGGFSEDDAVVVCQALDAEQVDFVELSGGSYERLAFFGGESTRKREAYFLECAEKVRRATHVPLMLTGGFRSKAAMDQALQSGAVDLIGLARPLIVEPDLPRKLISGASTAAAHSEIRSSVKRIDDFIQGTWYARQLRRMATGLEPNVNLNRWVALLLEVPRAWAFNPFRSPPHALPEATAGDRNA